MTSAFDYDVVVVGAGPGGYVCAIRAAQLGLRTACVDARDTLGGTCLNVGCIPSKALLHATHLYEQAAGGALSALGLGFGAVTADVPALMRAKAETVGDLTRGIELLFKSNGVDRLKGFASFRSPNALDVDGKAITAKAIVIATGSVPAPFAAATIDNEAGRIVDSTGALSLGRVPESLAVVGGGVIGLELGSVWRRLGANVTVVEYAEQILPGMDGDIRSGMGKILAAQGLEFRLATTVDAIVPAGNVLRLTLQGVDGAAAEPISAETVLVATGRRPNTHGLSLADAGLSVDDRGFIPVDRYGRTKISGIYAIGDVTAGPMLAHRAEDEGIAVAEAIAGNAVRLDHAIIPTVLYTDPEAASVGLTEDDLKRNGVDYRRSMFPMAANSRARTNREKVGFVKVLASAENDVVLGVHIIAASAGTMIAQAAQAMEFGATSEDIAYSCHAHPTHSEAIKEAAMGIRGKPIHFSGGQQARSLAGV